MRWWRVRRTRLAAVEAALAALQMRLAALEQPILLLNQTLAQEAALAALEERLAAEQRGTARLAARLSRLETPLPPEAGAELLERAEELVQGVLREPGALDRNALGAWLGDYRTYQNQRAGREQPEEAA